MNINPFFRAIDLITSPIRRLYNLIGRAIPGLKRLPSVSAPMLAAVIAWVALLIIFAIAVIIFWVGSTEFQNREPAIWIFSFLAIFVIPVIVYYLVKFWMIKEDSKFPNIDQIWETALEQCQQQGIPIRQVPIFLVLGVDDQKQASNLIKASHLQLSVAVPKQQDTDLVFFANETSVFLFLNGCSCLSGLSTTSSLAQPIPEAPLQSGSAAAGTIDASTFARMAGGSNLGNPASANVGGTLTEGAMQPAFSDAPSPQAAADFGRTMVLPEGHNFEDFLTPAGRPHEPNQPMGIKPPPALTSQEIFERQEKLKYVCQLIQRARQPVCPINGLLTVVPFDLVESASGQVQIAVQKDLRVLREELMVRCSNTVLVTQIEPVEGFQELVKRVGENECRESRFGRGSELWNAPSAERLQSIAAHAIGAFEDWIYLLFQKENALQQRYNSRLLGLLCRVRGKFAENLPTVLGSGFGFDPRVEPGLSHRQFLFGGCYFAGTGADPSKYAFVKSVFAKVLQNEGELEWTPEARERETRYQFWANLFALLGLVCLLSTAGLIAWNFWSSSNQ